MDQTRGVLFLADPLRAAVPPQKCGNIPAKVLAFHEGEPLLPQAQGALWELRRRCDWACVAASGGAVGVALALAAQLPVDRLALAGSRLFGADGAKSPREVGRMERFARRNLALVTAELLLADAADAEIRGYLRFWGRRRICALETGAPPEAPWSRCAQMLCAPWAVLNENNLLNPWKCV